MKHTPGPWYPAETGYEYAISKRHYVTDGSRRTICEMTEHAPTANARLIAAAPDLLEALENIENDDGHIPDTIWRMRTEALKKAGSWKVDK